MLFTLADVAVGPVFALLGAAAALLVLAVIVLGEAVVLRAMGWGEFGPCLVDSLLMNVVSAAVGLAAAPVLSTTGVVYWVVMLVLSIGIEGLVLQLRRRRAARTTWAAAGLANLASYAVMGALILAKR